MGAPVLPEPFDTAQVGASVTHRRRNIAFTVDGPGRLHRCTYRRAWVTVTERETWRADALRLTATRTTGDTWTREPFTDTAVAALAEVIVPAVARYGFGAWWSQLHQARTTNLAHQLNQAEAAARWWRDRQDLTDLYEHGQLTITPTSPDRTTTVRRITHNGNTEPAAVIAQATYNAEHIGWMTTTGDLIPPAHTLNPAGHANPT